MNFEPVGEGPMGSPEFIVSQAEVQVAQGPHLLPASEVGAVLWDGPLNFWRLL